MHKYMVITTYSEIEQNGIEMKEITKNSHNIKNI